MTDPLQHIGGGGEWCACCRPIWIKPGWELVHSLITPLWRWNWATNENDSAEWPDTLAYADAGTEAR